MTFMRVWIKKHCPRQQRRNTKRGGAKEGWEGVGLGGRDTPRIEDLVEYAKVRRMCNAYHHLSTVSGGEWTDFFSATKSILRNFVH